MCTLEYGRTYEAVSELKFHTKNVRHKSNPQEIFILPITISTSRHHNERINSRNKILQTVASSKKTREPNSQLVLVPSSNWLSRLKENRHLM